MDMFKMQDRLADVVYDAGRWLERKSFSLRPKFPVELPKNFTAPGHDLGACEMGFLRLDPVADVEIRDAMVRGYMSPRRTELRFDMLALVSPLSDDAVAAQDYAWNGVNWNADNAKPDEEDVL